MPDLTGIELSEHIGQKIQESHTDIIILTGLRERGKLVIGLEAGADDCLTKPFLSSELLAAGARVVESRTPPKAI
jgi:DNA-binding response OmpR family regulator